MNSKLKLLSVFAVLAMVIAAPMGVMAATPTVDTTNDADSTTTSDWTDGTTVTGFTANASNESYVEVSFDSAPSGSAVIKVLDPDTADTNASMEVVYSNSSADTVNSTSNNYAWNISHDELDDLPMESGENKTFTVMLTDSDDTDNATYIDVAFDNSEGRAVYRVGDSYADSAAFESEEAHPYLASISESRWGGDTTTSEFGDVPTTATTNHTFSIANDTASTSAADALGDEADGAWLADMEVTAEDNDGDEVTIPVFVNEKGDWDFLDDDEAYAVYDTNSDRLTVYLSGDERFDEASTTTFTVTTNEDIGFRDARQMASAYGAGVTSQTSVGLAAI